MPDPGAARQLVGTIEDPDPLRIEVIARGLLHLEAQQCGTRAGPRVHDLELARCEGMEPLGSIQRLLSRRVSRHGAIAAARCSNAAFNAAHFSAKLQPGGGGTPRTQA